MTTFQGRADLVRESRGLGLRWTVGGLEAWLRVEQVGYPSLGSTTDLPLHFEPPFPSRPSLARDRMRSAFVATCRPRRPSTSGAIPQMTARIPPLENRRTRRYHLSQ